MDIVFFTAFLSLVLIAIYYPQLEEAFQLYFHLRRRRPLRCPETGRLVSVKIDAAHAAFGALKGIRSLEIKDCTRWPGRLGCNQTCLGNFSLSNGTARASNQFLTRN